MTIARKREEAHILVTGGTGVMGSRLVRVLVNDGWRCRVLTLTDDPFISRLKGINCEIVSGDITDARSLEGIFDNVMTVYHLAAIIIARDPALFKKINTDGTKNIVKGATSSGVKHLIYISSASVIYPRSTPYSRSKKECEDIVKQQEAMNYTIIRPTLVYGKNGGQEFIMFKDYLMKYPVVPFIGRGRALKNPVDIDDLIQGLRAIAGNEKCYGKTYNFSGGEDMSIWDLAHLILAYNGGKKLFVPIPVWLCTLLAHGMEATMKRPLLTQNIIAGITQNANLDHSSAKEDIGYNPIGIREGMKKYFSDMGSTSNG